jgi:hypothetical protein
MKQRTNGQQLERVPIETISAAERYGRAEHPVSLRLVGVTEADVQLQIERLVLTFGTLLQATEPRQSGKGQEWIAYGTILQ